LAPPRYGLASGKPGNLATALATPTIAGRGGADGASEEPPRTLTLMGHTEARVRFARVRLEPRAAAARADDGGGGDAAGQQDGAADQAASHAMTTLPKTSARVASASPIGALPPLHSAPAPLPSLTHCSNFRERQRLHVAALEARVHELEAAIAATAAASTNLALSPAVGSPTDPQTLAIIAENSILRNCAISVNFSPSLAPGTPGCQTCAVEKARTLIALGQIHCLETRISELMAENHTLRTSAGHFSNAVLVSRDFQDSSGCADALMVEPSSQPMIVTTNVEVSPPALSVSVSSAMDEASLRSESSFPVNGLGSSVCISDLVESAKATLKAIPALKNCEFVEKLFDCYMQCRMLTDEDDFYDGCILFKYYRSKVIDLCTIVEQRDVMEALSEMMEKDIDVPPQDFLFREKFDLISDPVVRAEKIEKLDKERGGRVSAARAAFLSIPSLKNMDEYVDDFCITLFVRL
ncbi:hypothetical protein HDU84_002300, partial [Entophlyctis sp. JEL0112]